MATHTAVEGTITVGGTGVGSLRSLGLDTAAETIDATTITSTSKINKAGTTSFSGSAECYWDESDAVQVSMVEGTTVVNSVSISAATDGMVECSFSFTGTGALTRGTA